MQTRNDGTRVILPAAASLLRLPDRARLPVTLLRQTDGKLRHDGSSAAFVQPQHPSQSAEDCTAHRNSMPERGIVTQRIDSYIIAP